MTDVETFTLQRTYGKDLLVTLGENLVGSLEECVLELVSNAVDADADVVDIRYSPKTNTLTITDDGHGMDRETLVDFLRMGDSPKKGEGLVSPDGRRLIGSFGIGAYAAVRTLAKRQKVISRREGNEFVFEEEFRPDDTVGKDISFTRRSIDPEKKGVKIELKQLRFQEGDGRFNPKRIRQILRDEILSDTRRAVNLFFNREIISPIELVNPATYAVDFEVDGIGQVVGSIQYSSRPIAEGAGVYLMVNGRAVGGDNFESLGIGAKLGLARKVYGIIHVDGLDHMIKFDRTGFMHCPELDIVHSKLRDILNQVRRDMEGELKDQKIVKAQETLKESCATVGQMLATALGEEEPFTFVFDARKAGDLVYVDKGEGVVYVNPRAHPLRLSGLSARDVKFSLSRIGDFAMLGALASDVAQQERFEEFSLALAAELHSSRRGRVLGRPLSEIIPKEGEGRTESFDPSLRVSPARLYTLRELPERTGLSNSELKRLICSGILEERVLGSTILINRKGTRFVKKQADWQEARVLGKDITRTKERLEGKITLYAVVREVPKPEIWTSPDYAFRQTVEMRAVTNLDEMRGSLPSYMEDWAGENHPSFYVVDVEHIEELLAFINTGKFPKHIVRTEKRIAVGNGALVYAFGIDYEGRDDAYLIRNLAEAGEIPILGERKRGDHFSNESFVVHRGEQRYVIGVCTGNDNQILATKKTFLRQHFQEVPLPDSHEAVVAALGAKRRNRFPLVSVRAGSKPEYETLLEDMLASSGELTAVA